VRQHGGFEILEILLRDGITTLLNLNPGDETVLVARSVSAKNVLPGIVHGVLQINALLHQVEAGLLRSRELRVDYLLVPVFRYTIIEFNRNLVVDHPQVLLDTRVTIVVPHQEVDFGESHLSTRLDAVVTVLYAAVDCAPACIVFEVILLGLMRFGNGVPRPILMLLGLLHFFGLTCFSLKSFLELQVEERIAQFKGPLRHA
jgi:hypothetical protein